MAEISRCALEEVENALARCRAVVQPPDTKPSSKNTRCGEAPGLGGPVNVIAQQSEPEAAVRPCSPRLSP